MNNKKPEVRACYDFAQGANAISDRVKPTMRELARLLARRAAEIDYEKALREAERSKAAGQDRAKEDS